jgi:hypothetical protein
VSDDWRTDWSSSPATAVRQGRRADLAVDAREARGFPFLRRLVGSATVGVCPPCRRVIRGKR